MIICVISVAHQEKQFEKYKMKNEWKIALRPQKQLQHEWNLVIFSVTSNKWTTEHEWCSEIFVFGFGSALKLVDNGLKDMIETKNVTTLAIVQQFTTFEWG